MRPVGHPRPVGRAVDKAVGCAADGAVDKAGKGVGVRGGRSGGQGGGQGAFPGENGTCSVDELWMAKESWNQRPDPLVRSASEA
jgi:hypothetical protein